MHPVVCDMSRSFLSGVQENFVNASTTVDWFHVVQLFTRAVDDVRKAEHRENALPKDTRWAVLKSWETELTASQREALLELEFHSKRRRAKNNQKQIAINDRVQKI